MSYIKTRAYPDPVDPTNATLEPAGMVNDICRNMGRVGV